MIDLWLTLGLAVGSVALFVAEVLPPAMVSLLVMGALMVSGILDPAEGLSGLSNEATVTVAAMFVLSAGLDNTGILSELASRLGAHLEQRFRVAWIGLLIATGVASAFINNTAVVAMLIPVLIPCAREAGVSASKLLMPVSFVSMFGGMCTLLGTSTNLIVSSIAHEQGQAPIGMFELTPLGACCFGAGLLYLFLTSKWIPNRRPSDEQLTENFSMDEYLSALRVEPGAELIGQRLGDSRLVRDLDLDVLAVLRGGEKLAHLEDAVLEEGDRLRVRGKRSDIETLHRRRGLAVELARVADADLDTVDAMLVEVVVTARSKLAGHSLVETDFHERFGAVCLAVRQRGKLHHQKLADMKLAAGDVLLLALPRDRHQQLDEAGEMLVISHQPLQTTNGRRIPVAIAILAAVVLTASFGLVSIAVAAPAGAMGMVLTQCLELDEAYESIDWDVIFLLAGMLALGVAFQRTGADQLLADNLVAAAGTLGNHGVVAVIYLVTLLLTSTMSNNATAALLTPIAISVASRMDASPRPFIVAVAVAASASFLTPIGYQTNTMVYGAGHYRFGDFVRIGGPLSILFCVLASALIPVFWPF
jgi:di/tricarboxylate transporter